MKHTPSILLSHHALRIAVLCALAICPAFAQEPAVKPANLATVPMDNMRFPWWADRHKAVLEAVKSHLDTQLLMIGDSITNNYDKATLPDENFQPTWKQFYEPRKALNLGYSGDTTSHVLWRLANGEVAGLHPKVAVLLIGTNNTGFANQTAEQTESGIDAVIAELAQRLPETKILLVGILPSDISESKTVRDRAINSYLANRYGEHKRVTYLDISSIFYKNGTLNADLFYDPRLPQHGKPLHPDTNGQHMMVEAIEPTLAKLMGDAPKMALQSMADINTALIPVEKLEQDSYDWYERHHAELELQKTLNPRVVMIGDSITHFWGGLPKAATQNGLTAWKRLFGDMPVLNMGFGWDRTQNVLWRFRQGEFEGINPQWVVIAIGTNNLTGTSHARANTPAEIVEGIAAIKDEVRKRSPQSRIVVMAILPRQAEPNAPLREPIKRTNALLAKRFLGDASVTYLDLEASFLAPDGTLPTALMPDGTHPNDAGYQIWAEALIKVGVKP